MMMIPLVKSPRTVVLESGEQGSHAEHACSLVTIFRQGSSKLSLTPKGFSLLVCSKKEEVDSGDSLSQVTGQNTRKRNTRVLTVRPRLRSLDFPKVVEQIDLIFC